VKLLKNKKILIPLVLLIVVAAVGAKMFLLAPPPQNKKKLAKEPGPIYTLSDPFVVNLADSGGTPHFAKVGIALRVSKLSASMVPTAAEGATPPKMEADPEIRDIVIAALKKRTSVQLSTGRGAALVKHDIVSDINREVKDLKVVAVYYTDFAVQ
jgi:flagellar FliL protein